MSQVNRIERCRSFDHPIHCIYCGADTQVFELAPDEMTPCPHLLYLALDDGFMYLSEKAQNILKSLGFEVRVEGDFIDVSPATEELEEQYEGIDQITDVIIAPESFKIASYQPAPSFLGLYAGFAPEIE